MRRWFALLLAAALAITLPAFSQQGKDPGNIPPKKKEEKVPPNDRYSFKKEHDQDGIGKFYHGREIAHVMGYQAAGWLERKEREKEEKSSKLIEALQIQEGMKIADIGAGSGYFTFKLAKLVGPKGKVYAVDIQPEMLAIMKKRIDKEKITNVELVKGTASNPNLKDDSIDLILMVDVYHEFEYPYEMTQRMVQALRPNGKLVFVEYRMEDPKVPIKLLHKMSQAQVKKEMQEFKIHHAETINVLPWQHIIIFEKDADN